MKKKFSTYKEYESALSKLKYDSIIYTGSRLVELASLLQNIPEKTSSLEDALFLLKMIEEKIEEHNGRCRQKAGKMETRFYISNNVENQ